MGNRPGISGSHYRPLAQGFWKDCGKMISGMFGVLAAGIIAVDMASAAMGEPVDAIGKTCTNIFGDSALEAPCQDLNRGVASLTRSITGKPTILRL